MGGSSRIVTMRPGPLPFSSAMGVSYPPGGVYARRDPEDRLRRASRTGGDALVRQHGGVLDLRVGRRRLGGLRTAVPLVRHMAARDEHRLLDRHVSDGV